MDGETAVELNGAWPGTQLTQQSDGYWVASFDAAPINIIFNDGVGGTVGVNQTENIEGISGHTILYNESPRRKAGTLVCFCCRARAIPSFQSDRLGCARRLEPKHLQDYFTLRLLCFVILSLCGMAPAHKRKAPARIWARAFFASMGSLGRECCCRQAGPDRCTASARCR